MLTDIPSLCPLLRLNVAANFGEADAAEVDGATRAPKHCSVDVLPLYWGNEEHLSGVLQANRHFDVIIGSDVGYDSDAFGALLGTVATVQAAAAKNGKEESRAIVALCKRPEEFEAFEEFAKGEGWSWRVLEEVDMAAERGD